jgi:hypothetical protein
MALLGGAMLKRAVITKPIKRVPKGAKSSKRGTERTKFAPQCGRRAAEAHVLSPGRYSLLFLHGRHEVGEGTWQATGPRSAMEYAARITAGDWQGMSYLGFRGYLSDGIDVAPQPQTLMPANGGDVSLGARSPCCSGSAFVLKNFCVPTNNFFKRFDINFRTVDH